MNPITTARTHGLPFLWYSLTDQVHSSIAVLPKYRTIAAKYYRRKQRPVDTYEIPMQPLERRFVDPQRITHVSEFPKHGYPTKNRMDQLGRVVSGKWDTETPRFDSQPLVQSLRQRFNDGVAWKQTPYVKDVTTAVENDEMAWHNCQTVSDIEQRCEFVDQLYEQIRTQGYQTQAEITIQTSYPRELTNEVLVDIGRNGQLLFINGQHRLAIAKILELETIPVTVMVRHTNWMETLAAEYQRGDVRTHPDVGHLEA